MSTLKLKTCDGEIFTVDVELVKCSELLKSMLEVFGEADNTIPYLENVTSRLFGIILYWAYRHKDDPKPFEISVNELSGEIDISPWDVDFINNLDQGTMLDLLKAANYLNIEGLKNIIAQTIANMIKGKTPEEIRKTFNLESDDDDDDDDDDSL